MLNAGWRRRRLLTADSGADTSFHQCLVKALFTETLARLRSRILNLRTPLKAYKAQLLLSGSMENRLCIVRRLHEWKSDYLR